MLDYLNTILEQWPTNYQDRAVEVVSLVRNNAALSSQLSCLLVKKVLREKGREKRDRERGTEGGGGREERPPFLLSNLPFSDLSVRL